jgi:uncharacterized protein with PhoU and TrkA domain
MDRVGYEPVSVKAVLAEMKDTAELLIDLSYSAVLLNDREIAAEVLALEDRMDLLQMQARMSLLLAARSPSDAEELAPVLGVVGAAEKISDAAGDIAKVVIEEVGLPEAMRTALPEAVETLVRATVVPRSEYEGQSLGDANLETETGVRVIARRRPVENGAEWQLNPDRETVVRADDAVLLRGPESGVATLYEELTGEPYRAPEPAGPEFDDLERAVDSIVLMKNVSELAVDLAYGAILFDSDDLAREVAELEAEMDALQSRFEAWTLRAAAEVDDPVQLRGLIHLATGTEVISDAALEISEGVLRGLGTHPVVAEAVYESDEVLVRLTVAPDSELDGVSLGERRLKTETGMRVIAVRRGETAEDQDDDADWEFSPGPETRLHGHDVIIAKGTRTGASRLADLVGDDLDDRWE